MLQKLCKYNIIPLRSSLLVSLEIAGILKVHFEPWEDEVEESVVHLALVVTMLSLHLNG